MVLKQINLITGAMLAILDTGSSSLSLIVYYHLCDSIGKFIPPRAYPSFLKVKKIFVGSFFIILNQ